MSRRVIDDRVVEMEFDNSRFEKNVSTSLSTLDKLKAALRFDDAGDGFDKVETKVTELGKTFNLFEEIAIGALRKIGNEVVDWAGNMIKSLTGVENVMAGFGKFSDITKATGTLKGQGYALEEIEEQLARLNWFTDETSFKLADMVGNISKFTAAGQGLEESVDAMMGIALWAATAGQDATTASRAMYQLSQAMSAGYMHKEDWKSIQKASMDTRIFRQHTLDAAVALGTLKKNADGTYTSLVATGKAGAEAFSIDQFTERLTEGAWFTKDVMMSVYREYAGGVDAIYKYMEEHNVLASQAVEALRGKVSDFALEAFLAGQQARTWEDTISSVKDAASTGWMNIFQDLFGNYDEVVGFFTDLAERFYDIFVTPINKLDEAFQKWAEKGGRSAFIQAISNIVDILENFQWVFLHVFNKIVYGTTNRKDIMGIKTENLLKITEALKNFTEKVSDTIRNSRVFRRYLRAFMTIFSLAWQTVSQFGNAVKDTFAGTGKWISKIIEGLSYVVREFYYFGKRVKANKSIYNFFVSLLKPIKNLSERIRKMATVLIPALKVKWQQFKQTFNDKLGEPLKKLKASFDKIIETVKKFWESLFGSKYGAASGLTDTWNLFHIWDKIKETFRDIFGLKPGEIFDKLGAAIEGASKKLEEFYDWLNKSDEESGGMTGIEKIKMNIENALNWIKTTLGPVWDTVKKYLTIAFNWIVDHWGDIWGFISDAASAIWGFISGIGEGIGSIFSSDETSEDKKTWLQDLIDFFKSVGVFLGKLFAKVKELLQPIIDYVSQLLDNITFDDVSGLLKAGGLAAVGAAIYQFAKTIRESNLLKGLNEILGGVGDVLNSFAHSVDAKALKDAAIGLAILVGTLFLLMGLPIDKITEYGLAFASFVTIIVLAIKKLKGGSKGFSVSSSGLSYNSRNPGSGFIQIALGILVIAYAMKMIADVPKEDLVNAAAVITMIVFVVSLVVRAYARIGKSEYYDNQQMSGNTLISIKKKGGLGGALLGLAALVFVISYVVKQVMGYMKEDYAGFKQALIYLAGILGAIMVFMLVAKIIKTMPKGLAVSLIALAASIYIIVLAIEQMTKIKSAKKLDTALEAVVIILGLFAVIMWIAGTSAFNKESGALLGMAAGLLVLSVAVAAMVGIIYLLAQAEGDIKTAGIVVGGLIVLMGLFAVFGGSKFVDGDKLIKAAAAMVILGAAIGVVAASMYLLAQIPADKMWTVIGLLAAAVAGLSVLMFVAKFTGDAIVTLATAFGIIAGTLALLAIAFALVVEAMKVLSSETLDTTQIATNIDAIFSMLIVKLPEWIGKVLEIILLAIASLFATAADVLVTTFSDTVAMLLENDTIVKLVNGVADLIVATCDALKPRVPEIVNSVGDLFLEILKALGSWLKNNSEELGKAIGDIIEGIIDVVLGTIDTLGEAIFGSDEWTEFKGDVKEAVTNVIDWIKGAIEDVWQWIVGVVKDIMIAVTDILVALGIIDSGVQWYNTMEEAQEISRKKRLTDYYMGVYKKNYVDNAPVVDGVPIIDYQAYDKAVEKAVDAAMKNGYDYDPTTKRMIQGTVNTGTLVANGTFTTKNLDSTLGSDPMIAKYFSGVDQNDPEAMAAAMQSYLDSKNGKNTGGGTTNNTTVVQNITTTDKATAKELYRLEKNGLSKVKGSTRAIAY